VLLNINKLIIIILCIISVHTHSKFHLQMSQHRVSILVLMTLTVQNIVQPKIDIVKVTSLNVNRHNDTKTITQNQH
jgi:hypothetical protein